MQNLIARTENNKVLIAMYETEKPKREECVDYNGEVSSFEYEQRLKQWQSPKREYAVRESDKEEIRKALKGVFLNCDSIKPRQMSWTQVDIEFAEALEKGIDCTFLKDRLKLGCNCEYCTFPHMKVQEKHYPCDNCGQLVTGEYSWSLLPLEDKKENEAVEFAKKNAEEDYIKTPISVLKYIGVLENQIFKNPNKQE